MIINSNSLYIPLKDRSVQICVTSPPYYGLRDYGESNQIGLEETPEAYVEKLVQVFREVWRVLKDDGTLWLNLGDSYAANRGYQVPDGKWKDVGNSKGMKASDYGVKPKDLIGIPWMVAFALRADGWYLRSDIIWHKPNPMPESVKDRPTKSHEYIFLLSKNQRYYYDADAIREPSVEANWQDRYDRSSIKSAPDEKKNGIRNRSQSFKRENSKRATVMPRQTVGTHRPDREENQYGVNTRNKRSVWTVTTKPYSGAHFAVFPPDLIEPCILAGTSEKGQCPECGATWVRVVERTNESNWEFRKEKGATGGSKEKGNKQQIGAGWSHDLPSRETVTTGWEPSCGCDAGDPVPQIVLDPFSGSGTTGQVAIQYRRQYVGLELNMDYIELSKKRMTTDVMLPGIL